MDKIKNKEQKKLTKQALQNWAASARRETGYVTALNALASLAWIGLAFSLGIVVEALLGGQDATIALIFGAVCVALRAGLIVAGDRLSIIAGHKMVSYARGTILGTLKVKGAPFIFGRSSGERVSEIIDRTAKLEGYAARWIPGMRHSLIGPIIIVIAVFTQSWVAGALLLLTVCMTPVFLWLTGTATAAAAKAQQDSLEALSGAFETRAANAGLIKMFRAVGRETQALQDAAEEVAARTMRVLRYAFLNTAVLEFFASISIAMVAVYIGFKLLGEFPFATGETLTLKEGMIALVLAPEFFAPIRRLSSLHHDRGDATAAAEHLALWLNEDGVITPTRLPRLADAPSLVFDRVTLSYDGETPCVSDVSFDVQPGQLTVISGPSGSGKTSLLLSLLATLHRLEGEIKIDDRALANNESLAESMSFVRQSPWAVEGNVRDNLQLLSTQEDENLFKVLLDVGLATNEYEALKLLDRALGRGGEGLSGGQRQRLTLARALLRDAPIWLFDEPSSHLDPEAEADLIALIQRHKNTRTVLVASHSRAFKNAADCLIDLSRLKPSQSEKEPANA
ncbi:MAG: thiol reductant ABC exporter subunit CydD [Pseudomonadota bacterium]